MKAPIGPSVFMKPNLPSKKKFQMAAPSVEETNKFDKLVVQEVKRADQMSILKRDNSNSGLKNKLDANLVAPKALVTKTQE